MVDVVLEFRAEAPEGTKPGGDYREYPYRDSTVVLGPPQYYRAKRAMPVLAERNGDWAIGFDLGNADSIELRGWTHAMRGRRVTAMFDDEISMLVEVTRAWPGGGLIRFIDDRRLSSDSVQAIIDTWAVD